MTSRSGPDALRSFGARSAHAIRRMLALRRCDVVGRDVRLRGPPGIDNRGRMEIGDGVIIASRPVATRLATGPDGSLLIRDHVYIGYGTSIDARGLIAIGEGTRIGALATFLDTDRDDLSGLPPTSRPVIVGRGVGIGSSVTVLPGSFIGNGARIAAGAVVSGIIPERCFASGVPATVEGAPAAIGGNLEERVLQVIGNVFWRRERLPLSLEPERMSGWDAAGALRLTQALEREFATSIPDDEFMSVLSLSDIVEVVRRAVAGAGAPATVGVEAAHLH